MFTSQLIKVDKTAVFESRNFHKFRLLKNKYESNETCGITRTWPNKTKCIKFYVKNSLIHFICQNGL